MDIIKRSFQIFKLKRNLNGNHRNLSDRKMITYYRIYGLIYGLFKLKRNLNGNHRNLSDRKMITYYRIYGLSSHLFK